jgi:hypothetical protein
VANQSQVNVDMFIPSNVVKTSMSAVDCWGRLHAETTRSIFSIETPLSNQAETKFIVFATHLGVIRAIQACVEKEKVGCVEM